MEAAVDISGSTAKTYVIAAADAGKTLRLEVTASNAHGSAVATSVQSAVVSSPPPPPPPGDDWDDFVGLAAYRTGDIGRIASIGVRRVRWDRPSASHDLGRPRSWDRDPADRRYNPWPDLNGGKGDKYPPLPQYYEEWSKRMIDTWRTMSTPPTAIEVWNEPWLRGFWAPTPSPSAYLQLVRTFANQAWAVWPNMTILVSADTVGQTTVEGNDYWRQSLLAADTTGFLNDPRIHPTTHNYVEGRTPTTVTGEPCKWDLDRFKCAYNDFKAHGHPDPKVWVTEYGWDSGTVGETKQADYMEQALGIFRNSGKVAAAYRSSSRPTIRGRSTGSGPTTPTSRSSRESAHCSHRSGKRNSTPVSPQGVSSGEAARCRPPAGPSE